MYLKSLELSGFKSFAKKSRLEFGSAISAIVGPNGSGKSNIAEAFRFALGEQSMKSLRGKRGEDLIWNGSDEVPRANRAGVKLVFNNEPAESASRGALGGRLFDIDFDEVVFERVVHRDGVNIYSINDSQVRLRDVIELLSGANIGASGHHIISQGEADRVLSAHPNERREMIEDALGLKIYQYKKRESERRLEKTEENIAHVEGLRKEIAPHLSFLKKQVEKVEKNRALADLLREHYREYLIAEVAYVEAEGERITNEKKEPESHYARLEAQLTKAKETLTASKTHDEKSDALLRLEKDIRGVREEKEELSRSLGRVEGEIAFEEKRRKAERAASGRGVAVPLSRLEDLEREIRGYADEAETLEDAPSLKALIEKIRDACAALLAREAAQRGVTQGESGEDLAALVKKRDEMEVVKGEHGTREAVLEGEYVQLQKKIESEKSEERSAERAIFSIREEQNALHAALAVLEGREAAWRRASEDLEREREEARALLGSEFVRTIETTPPNPPPHMRGGGDGGERPSQTKRGGDVHEPREKQESRRRELERMKIRLEEFGGGSGDEIMKEYQEVEERDSFLKREIADLHTAADTLSEVIDELEKELATKFQEGIVQINKEFQNFFSLMFGGGTAALSVAAAPPRGGPAGGGAPTTKNTQVVSYFVCGIVGGRPARARGRRAAGGVAGAARRDQRSFPRGRGKGRSRRRRSGRDRRRRRRLPPEETHQGPRNALRRRTRTHLDRASLRDVSGQSAALSHTR